MTKEIEPATKRSPLSNWWVSILLAITAYMGLKYLIPGLGQEGSSFFTLCQAAPKFAPLAAIPFLLLAAKQLYDTELPKKDSSESENNDEEDAAQ